MRMRRRATAVLATLLACACSPGDPPETGASPRRAIVKRLDASHFVDLPAPFHGAVAKIGDEARPVLVAARSTRVASALDVAPDADGFVRAEITLPQGVRELPDAAFVLEAQRLPASISPELVPALSKTVRARQITEGWQLLRDAGDRASLRYEHGDSGDEYHYSLHLFALEPPPAHYASRSFDIPAGATLELAYGMVTPANAAGRLPAKYEAVLACEGTAPVRAVEQVLDPSAEADWHDAFVSQPERGRGCRLDLTAAGPAGEPIRGAVWAVPRIVSATLASEPSATNLVVISLDTLRADHLSGFGYPRATSPQIDAELIAKGTTFTDVSSTYSRTDVSHMSLFSGLYPEARPDPGRIHVDVRVPLLAERLRDAGYRTAAYTENALLAGAFGFWFGFDQFREHPYRHQDRGGGTFGDGIAFLRANRNQRFFVFLHTYKTHEPYVPSPAYESLFGDALHWERAEMGAIPRKHRPLVDAYDRTIREADDLVAGFLRELEELGLAEETLVVLLSDHGEAFGEHGLMGHSFSSEQEVIRVPVVFRGPGIPAGVRVDTPTSLVDVAPTIFEWLGLEPLPATQGISLAPAFRGEDLPENRALFFSWLADDAIGIRQGRWKYRSVGEKTKLFDLERDPLEQRAISQPEPHHPSWDRLLSDHHAESSTLRASFDRAGDETPSPAISEEMERSLRALGYID